MSRFSVVDHVEPRPEWVGNANNIPTGFVKRIEPWGRDGALVVGDEPRAFVASVFRLVVPFDV